MHNIKTIFTYSFRILVREWRKFILPFLSLTFTTVIVFSVLLFTSSSSLFLQDKAKELLGGDLVLESTYELTEAQVQNILGNKITVTKSSQEQTFSALVRKGEFTTPVSFSVVDKHYPLYGGLTLTEGLFETPKNNEIYIDKNAQNKLNVGIGDEILYAEKAFVVKGIVEKDSKALLSGAAFLPKVFISSEGFARTNIDKTLLRSEYLYVFLVEKTPREAFDEIISRAKQLTVQVDIAGVTESRFIKGLALVKQFLILAVLLSCILSAVNIYAGMLYLLNIMRKSFAVMIALGFEKKKLAATLSLSLFSILFLSSLLGILLSILLFSYSIKYISLHLDLVLPFVSLTAPTILTLLVVVSISFSSFVPSLLNLLKLDPKTLLLGGQEIKEKKLFTNFILVTLSALIPLLLIAVFLLESLLYGAFSITAIIVIYALLAVIFYYAILALYKKRDSFKFLFRTLIAYKYADGLFGIVSLTSLYVALTTLSLLILLQSSISDFIKFDLGERVPSLYVIDIQKSQTEKIKEEFKDLNLFPQVGARIVSIDGVDIQKGLESSDKDISRELRREFSLTYRESLLPGEKVLSGVWLSGQPQEVSVEKDFADRANIKLGSTVVMSISGFTISSVVTSIRESDSRSGLPFFYFIFNPQDLERYPATFFGYSYREGVEKTQLTNFLANNFPNVSFIDTAEVRSFAQNLVSGLLVIIFVISLPPLILALFLIVTLIISSFSGRRKQSAQLMALGARKIFIEKLYYRETLSTTVVGGLLGYATAVLATFFITTYYLKIKSTIFYDSELLIALGVIILSVFILATILWRTEKKPLRELLSYEER